MIKSKKLSPFLKIKHGFFNRSGGVSDGIYKSLNCGIGSKDKKTNVKKNLQIIKKKLGSKTKEIFLVKQYHSNKFIYLNKNCKIKTRTITGDAIVSEKKGVPIAVLTADCVPILVYDHQREMIAAIHAGWRGAYKDIIKKVIHFMTKQGCKTKNMIAAIGPAISQKNYEVGLEFKKKFLIKNKDNNKFFSSKKKMIYFDLKSYVRSELKSNLINKIDLIDKDTYVKKNNFFSARRSLKLKNDDYGRNISVIMIN